MEFNTSTVGGGKVGTQVQQKLIAKAAAKQTYLLTTKNLLRPYSNRICTCTYSNRTLLYCDTTRRSVMTTLLNCDTTRRSVTVKEQERSLAVSTRPRHYHVIRKAQSELLRFRQKDIQKSD